MLEDRQFQQRGQVAHQLSGDDQHQNGNQHRAKRDRLKAFHPLYRRGHVPQRDILKEAKRRMNFRPQHDDRQQRDQHQQGTHKPQRLGTDGIEIDLADLRLHRSFRAADVNRLIFAAGALSENFRATMAGPVEGQPAALDQHPAADDVIDHQQQEPDGDRGFQTRKQRLGGGEVADGGRQHGHQRGAKHQVPQQAVHHIVAIPLFIQIERNTGVLKAQGDHRQRAADQQEAQAAQRSGEFAVVKIIEHDQRHNQRHNQPDAHQVVAHRFRHAVTRPAEVGDKQPVWPGEGGADHHHPQQRHRRGDSIANRHRQRERPGGLQTIAERHPQHRQRRGHQYRPEDRAQRQPEVILGDFPHPGAGALKEAGEMASGADAKANQQQGGKQRQQGLFAGEHHRAGFAQLADGIQGDQTP